ncbi:hypothetical protein AJ79_08473 [Helicocarpus griseus UAMH5409]|uniref:AAR2 family protein n=1 Tax=Helicocarpus griseus UAMH5409 TaxID=1447875 RepID=A0A2B7WJR2_9EURO|nr:hypothetical protein AJ79_08473 [Helicocarpus griseus UAMH5409]
MTTPTPTLLLPSLPPKILIGIDLLSFTSTPHFAGIKNLPPGPHFLYTGTTESFSLRSGEWIFVRDDTALTSRRSIGDSSTATPEIHIRKWDAETEALVPLDEGTEAGRREGMMYRANLGRIWASGGLLGYERAREEAGEARRRDDNGGTGGAQLVASNHHHDTDTDTDDWPLLTNYISPAVLERILPSSTTSTSPRCWTISSGSTAARDRDDIPGLSAADVARATASSAAGEQEKELRFLPIDLKRTWRAGAVGRERTEAAKDRSWALGDIIGGFGSTDAGTATTTATDNDDKEAGEKQILGELQFTFLMVLTLMNFSCLEQWKRLLGLLLTCRAAVVAREGFFVSVIRLLRVQLRHFEDVEGGLFEMDGDEGGALLRKLLGGFVGIVTEIEGDADADAVEGNNEGLLRDVKRELGLLEEWVQREYGWELRRGMTVRRGMVDLEDGERVELEVAGAEEEDESGDYAPVVVDLGEGEFGGDAEGDIEGEGEGEVVSDVDMSEMR